MKTIYFCIVYYEAERIRKFCEYPTINDIRDALREGGIYDVNVFELEPIDQSSTSWKKKFQEK